MRSQATVRSWRSTFIAVCLVAYVCAGWVLLKMMLKDRIADPLSPLIFILLYVTEAKTVSYTMNGQESAFMVCFLAIGFFAAYNGFYRYWKILAFSFTGLLYTRPDSPVYIAALCFAGLMFRTENRKESWRGIVRAAVIAAILFAPWFIGVWIYYGQPIPNTVLAKSGFGDAQLSNPFGTLRLVLMNFPLGAQAGSLTRSTRHWAAGRDRHGYLQHDLLVDLRQLLADSLNRSAWPVGVVHVHAGRNVHGSDPNRRHRVFLVHPIGQYFRRRRARPRSARNYRPHRRRSACLVSSRQISCRARSSSARP